MAKRIHTYPKPVLHAAELLGAQVREARLQRRWSVRELAERAGISTGTLHKVERGDPSVLLGTAFDVATLVGVSLYHDDRSRLADEALRSRSRLALLPRAVRPRASDLDNEF
jgi:transcriptional regulator with XRE-family HTH domain